MFTISYLLQRPEIATDQRIYLAQTIHHETQRLNDLSNLESGRAVVRLSSFDPRQLLEECLHVAQIKADEKNIEMSLVISEHLADITADRDKLKQAMLNLLGNAVKYNRPQGKAWLRAWQKPNELKIAVEDNGLGIPTDQISRLFTKFFRARNVEGNIPGTGLGLSITRRIIEMHNGHVQVESKIESGTTFTIWLPVSSVPV